MSQSAQQAVPSVRLEPAPLPVEPLISTSPATQATSTSANTTAGAMVVILLWVVSIWHVTVPNEVAIAFTVLIGSVVHFIVILSMKEKQT